MRYKAARSLDLAVGSRSSEQGAEFGQLQLSYLVKHGLLRTDRMLEIGCGNLRAGRFFIGYLEAGNYYGIDISPEILLSAQQVLVEDQLQDKVPRLAFTNDLTLAFLPARYFNVVHANRGSPSSRSKSSRNVSPMWAASWLRSIFDFISIVMRVQVHLRLFRTLSSRVSGRMMVACGTTAQIDWSPSSRTISPHRSRTLGESGERGSGGWLACAVIASEVAVASGLLPPGRMNTHRVPWIACCVPWIAIGCIALAACSSTSTSTNIVVHATTGLLPGVTGVTCRDNTSDAARMQAVIDASAPGAVIQIIGTCLLTRGLVLAGDRTYVGGSTTGTVLKQDGPMSFVLASSAYVDNSASTGDPVQIRDLTVTCDGAGSTDGIIVMNWQTDVQLIDVHGCGGSGIVDTSVAQNGRPINNTSVNSRFEDNFISNSGEYGFEVLDPVNAVTDGLLTDNQIAYSGADGIYLQNSEGWVISGNHLYGDGADGINATRLYASTISGNYIEDFGATRRSRHLVRDRRHGAGQPGIGHRRQQDLQRYR